MDGRNEKQDQGRRLAGVVLEEKKRRDAEAFIQMKERLHQQEGIFFCVIFIFLFIHCPDTFTSSIVFFLLSINEICSYSLFSRLELPLCQL